MYTEINHFFLLYIIFIVMLSYFCIATICIINRLSNSNYNNALTFIIKFFQGDRRSAFGSSNKGLILHKDFLLLQIESRVY